MPDQHAVFSASSAECWINCPGFIHMKSLFPESSSTAAEEGTLAHELAAFLIDHLDDKREDLTEGLDAIKKKVDAFYEDHKDLGDDFAYMLRTLEPYVDFVKSEYQAALKEDPAAVLMTEQRVDFSNYVPGGFGTSDVVIIGDGKATIIDLKYGKGVAVSAVNNPQIRLYAIGAINAFDLLYDFNRVKVVIYQPRKDSVTEEDLALKDLKDWADTVVRPAAEKAKLPDPPYHPGEWCLSHFCPGAAICRARASWILSLERHSGKDPAILTDEEIADALAKSDALSDFVKKLQDYALGSIMEGHKIPGWKIIEGVSKRAYTDQDAVAAAAVRAGYNEALLYKKTLIGITDMEKLMGKKVFQDVLGALVIKPKGSPKLAPESDKRPAYSLRDDLRDEFD
jgi:hypothetical protein